VSLAVTTRKVAELGIVVVVRHDWEEVPAVARRSGDGDVHP
jgi:hypothetical protein